MVRGSSSSVWHFLQQRPRSALKFRSHARTHAGLAHRRLFTDARKPKINTPHIHSTITSSTFSTVNMSIFPSVEGSHTQQHTQDHEPEITHAHEHEQDCGLSKVALACVPLPAQTPRPPPSPRRRAYLSSPRRGAGGGKGPRAGVGVQRPPLPPTRPLAAAAFGFAPCGPLQVPPSSPRRSHGLAGAHAG